LLHESPTDLSGRRVVEFTFSKASMMKVAFIGFDLGEYCVRLASGLAQTPGTHVRLFMPRAEVEPYSHLVGKSVELCLFDKPRMRQVFQQVRMAFNLVRKIRAFNPDVIHLQLGHLWFNLLALPFLRRFPLVLTVHDSVVHLGDASTGKTPQWVYDYGCFQARDRIVHAQHVKDLLVKRLGIPASTVHLIPHVMVGDVDDMALDEVQETATILFFGRIWPYKGLDYLIQAEPSITARVPQVKIVIAGEGEDFTRYRQMMVNADNFVVHNEIVSDSKRAELFRQASVVVLPYIEASQSGIISIAYRFAKPVVASRVGGLPEMVDDGLTGFLVPPRDVEALADAVVTLLTNDELRRRLGQNGKRKVNSECAPAVVGRQTRVVYRQAVNGPFIDTDNSPENRPAPRSSDETLVQQEL
jgi:glycosyltransferase involved in cell wall biosynthesis